VVVLTSSEHERDLTECYRLGVNSYIQKPVDLLKFQETVKQFGAYWLALNRYPPDAGTELECARGAHANRDAR
jgi:two-component system, response regulator